MANMVDIHLNDEMVHSCSEKRKCLDCDGKVKCLNVEQVHFERNMLINNKWKDEILMQETPDNYLKMIQSNPILSELAGNPILLMITIKVLPYFKEFYASLGDDAPQPKEGVERDLKHIYTYLLFKREEDKYIRATGCTKIARERVFNVFLTFAMELASLMYKNNHTQINEQDLFKTGNKPVDEAQKQYLRFFSPVYLKEVHKSRNDYKKNVAGFKHCVLLRSCGLPGSQVYEFLHEIFITYLNSLIPSDLDPRNENSRISQIEKVVTSVDQRFCDSGELWYI